MRRIQHYVTLVFLVVVSTSFSAYAASITLPPTGQTTCQDMDGLPIPCAGTGQDGELRKGVVLSGPRFTVNSHVEGDSVTDNLTTLVWAKDANLLFNRDLSFDTDGFGDPDGRISTKTALAYIDKLNAESFGGHNDWRLPNRNELMSLIDTERVNPALPSGHPFINVQNTVYGTNSADKGRPVAFTWRVDMKNGSVGTGYSDSSSPVNFWPVRGGFWAGPGGKAYLPATNQKLCYDYSSYSTSPVPCATTSGQDGNLQKGVAWPEFRFSSLDDGYVRDALTNLVWTSSSNTPGPAACNPGVNRNWLEAFEYIDCLNTNAYLGASNWRMPNRNELSSLSYIEGEFPPVDHPFDINNNYFLFHSSTPVAADDTTVGESEEMNAWTVRMDGWISMQGKSAAYPVWPVRDFQIVIPTTGQITSYATGDDGAMRRGLTASPPRFVSLGDTAYDTLTGLTWAKFVNADGPEICVPYEPKDRAGAFAFIDCLNSEAFLGYIDWRLPNRNELMSLVDSGQANPALPSGHPFQEMPAGGASFWTSSRGEFSGYGWYVDFTNGTTGPEVTPNQTHHVWAVHEGDWEGPPTMAFIPATGQTTADGIGSDGDLRLGVAWPAPRFSDNGNGTVTDNLTAMVWTKDANTPDPDPTGRSACNQETTLTWADALNHVTCLNNSNYLGFSDWRLPNRREMASIIDMEQRSPAIPTGHPFSNLQSNFSYWSSTTAAADTTKAIVIGMGMGNESLWAKGDSLPVWPVRGGVFMPSDTTKPVVNSLVFAAYSNALTIQITEFTASDNVGVTDYCLSETNSSASCSWTGSAPTSHTFADVGLRSLYAFARDAIGNVSDSVRRVVYIDMTQPVITEFTLPATHTSSTLRVPVTLQATDNTTVTGYCLSEINDVATCIWQEAKPVDYTFSAEGTVTLFAFVKDVAGNISKVSVASGDVIYFMPVHLPRTGRTSFPLHNIMGDDASLRAGMEWPIPRFINNGDGSVSDELTTLLWSLDAGTPGPVECNPAAAKNWQEALDYIACLNTNGFLGYTDWRLPNINELRSLLSFHITSTGDHDYEYFLPLNHPFTEVHNSYWSSTSGGTLGETPAAIVVNLFASSQLSHKYPKNGSLWVWPVRGGLQQTEPTVRSYVLKTGQTTSYYPGDDGALQIGAAMPPTENRFTAIGDGTTADLLTDLIWTSNIVPADNECINVHNYYSPSASLVTCLNSKNYLGYSDWRSPNIVELGSLQIWSGLPDALPTDHPFTGLGEGSLYSSDNIYYRYYDPMVIDNSSTTRTSFAWFLGSGEHLLATWDVSVGMTPSSFLLVRGGVYEDVSPPRIENFQLPVVSADLTFPVSNLDFVDNAGVIYYCLTENDNTDSCDWQRLVSNVNSSFVVNGIYDYGKQKMLAIYYTFSSEGNKTLYAFARDAWGNISTGTAATIRVDTTNPVVTGVSMPVRYTSQTVPVTLTATDNLGISDYCLSEINSSNNCVWQSTLPTFFTFTSDGIKTLYAFVRDTAGNVSLGTTPANVTIDSAGPTISAFALQKSPLSLTVQITFTATDFNGVTGYCVGEVNNSADCSWQVTAPTSYTFGAQGPYTLYAFARDVYGNVSTRSASIGIDFEPPVITGLILPSHSTSLTIPVTTFTATDNFPDLQYCLIEINSAVGCLWQSVLPTNFTLKNEGPSTVYAFVKDIGDNVSEPMSANILVDSVLPIITEFTIPSLSGSLEIPVTLTATDNIAVTGYCLTLEGTVSSCTWQPTPPTTYTFPNSGMRGVTAFVRDANGNVRQYPTTRIITIDTIPPVVSIFTIPVAATSLTVAVNQLTVIDGTTVTYCLRENSDPAGCVWTDIKPTLFTFSSAGNRTLYAFAKDAGGNVSAPASRSIFIDTNPPVITNYSIPATSDSLTVPVTITATDNSGVVAGYCLREVQSIAGCVWNPTPPTSYTFSTDGTRSLYAFAIDAGGYVSSGRVASITIATLQPVRIGSATPVYYPTLQGAYNVAAASNIIQLKAGSLTNDLQANRNITVTLEGGAYSTVMPNTTIKGVVRISAGKVIMNRIAIAP